MPARLRFRNLRQAFDQLYEEEGDITKAEMRRRNALLLGDLRRDTPKDTGRAANSWRSTAPRESLFQHGYTSQIINDVDYITDLNEGKSSQQSPKFIERDANRYYTQIRAFPINGRR